MLGFPCNQFGCEEPGTDAEIKGKPAPFSDKYLVFFGGIKVDMDCNIQVQHLGVSFSICEEGSNRIDVDLPFH